MLKQFSPLSVSRCSFLGLVTDRTWVNPYCRFSFSKFLIFANKRCNDRKYVKPFHTNGEDVALVLFARLATPLLVLDVEHRAGDNYRGTVWHLLQKKHGFDWKSLLMLIKRAHTVLISRGSWANLNFHFAIGVPFVHFAELRLEVMTLHRSDENGLDLKLSLISTRLMIPTIYKKSLFSEIPNMIRGEMCSPG